MVERSAFITAMRRVASSVTVVTTAGPGGQHGATISSFCSVSADPPSVLVCLRADSRIAKAVVENGVYCANVLKESEHRLAETFAGRRPAGGADRFAGLALKDSGHPSPVLAAAVTAFASEVTATLRVGTHLIVVGRVVEVTHGGENPLAYLDGGYRSIGG